jgi:hypothetical protein
MHRQSSGAKKKQAKGRDVFHPGKMPGFCVRNEAFFATPMARS